MNRYHYVYHKDTDEQAFRLQEGEFEGVVWNFKDVKMPLDDKEGNRIKLEEVEHIHLTFGYDLLYNDNVVNEKSIERFNQVIGDILMNVIDEGIEHDQIKVNGQAGDNDTQQPDPQ